MTDAWIADRTRAFDSSGIRKVFDLAREMESPIDLSIGQPDYDVPEPVRAACIEAIASGKNSYALTQGMPVLREKLQARIDAQYSHADRRVFVSSGTSGGIVLTLLCLVNPGDEVIIFDPYFVMYEALTRLVGGVPVLISTYPDFRIPLDRVAAAITSKTKLILLNSPANPTGAVATTAEIRGLADLAQQHDIALLSDEIYSQFCYDAPFESPASYNPRTIVIDGFSKTYGMTGWRLGYVHGPAALIDTMIKVQQYTFVCAPQPVQWAGAAALDVDVTEYTEAYHRKRDLVVNGLSDLYEIANPRGAFYVFPRAPWGTGSEFVSRALEHKLLVIPGKVFSPQDTHFRLSYAAPDEVIQRGVDVLRRLARG
ncbi:MAG: aminotransferase class I/II-fold pyridoxal phosphate-dependent enzyme [Pirellulaceae bacterium]|jgi:aspartate aminotransferase/aminotransferase|nr:aminotransferase class I/II-fold pyridoxal phosphate-dependent enzyme [Pirellulaceae bacterium]